MGKYQAYPQYKDSGFGWLGNIPTHWVVSPIKWQIEKVSGGAWGQDPNGVEDTFVLRSTEQTHDGEWKIEDPASRRLSPQEAESTLLKEDDLLMTKSSGSSLHIGKTTIVTGEIAKLRCGYSNFMQRIRIKEDYIARFYWYIFNNELARKQLDYLSSSTTGLANLNATVIGEIICSNPPKVEQEKIVYFLDHETAKIDTLIDKQQQLIQLLKEKRQAVISHAVTKGLNPNAPMRDSGVEWLGEVPEHWEQVKLKYIVKNIIDAEHKTAEYFDDGEYLVCRTTNVRDGQLVLEGGKYTNLETYTEWIKRGKPEAGDILFTREAPAGEACVYWGDVPLCLGQRMVLFKLKTDRALSLFVLHSLYSGLADSFIKQLSQGSTVAHFNMADIRNIPLFEPPMEEQSEINNYLSNILSKYDDLMRDVTDAIELLQERRTALISAAVTGKIDVRQHVSRPASSL